MATSALAVEERAQLGSACSHGGEGPYITLRPEILEAFRDRIDFDGVLIDRTCIAETVPLIRAFLNDRRPRQIVTVNLDFLAIAARDPEFRATINQADLAVADGMPLVWLSHLLGLPLAERVTGNDLVDQCCRVAAERGGSVFLLGAAPGVASKAASHMRQRYPGLKIAGAYSPPFGPLSAEEDQKIVAMIRAARPDVLFVALGAPCQDRWIADHREQLGVPVSIGVGCVLDVLAGVVNRAPAWMQRAGLEWSYRLLQEPSRLWRRYFVDDLPMLGRLTLGALRRRGHAYRSAAAAEREGDPRPTWDRRCDWCFERTN